MTLVSLKNIITHILQAHGFEVYERDGILMADNGTDNVTVGLFDRVTVQQIRTHGASVSGTVGAHIICVLEPTDTIEEEARRTGLVLWDKADLEKELGLAIASRLGSGDTLFSGLLRAPEKPASDEAIVVECLGTEGTPHVFKSNLALGDVKEISSKTIQGFKHELELVPYYIFDYSCTFEGKDGVPVSRSGKVSVNALTGKYEHWDREPESDASGEHVIQLEPKIDQENARKIALHAITVLNTQFKEVIMEMDHATIIEKATFKPGEDDITIESQAMVMMPVWCVEGKHGVMILDGITGKVISEDYFDSH